MNASSSMKSSPLLNPLRHLFGRGTRKSAAEYAAAAAAAPTDLLDTLSNCAFGGEEEIEVVFEEEDAQRQKVEEPNKDAQGEADMTFGLCTI